jgi:hypothetical protein
LAPIHAIIALRLAGVSVVLATLFGAIAYVVEADRVEDVAVNLALRAASHYDEGSPTIRSAPISHSCKRWAAPWRCAIPPRTGTTTESLYAVALEVRTCSSGAEDLSAGFQINSRGPRTLTWLALHRAWRAKP